MSIIKISRSKSRLHPRSERAFKTILKHHGFDSGDINFMSFGVMECGHTNIINSNQYKSRSIAKDIKHCGLGKLLKVTVT